MEEWLETSKYIAGNEISIADLSAACELGTILAVDYDLEQHKKVTEWYKRVLSIPEVKDVLKTSLRIFTRVKEKKKAKL